MDGSKEPDPTLFAQPQVSFYIVETAYSAAEIEKLRNLLTLGGAKEAIKVSSSANGQIDVEAVTHVISNTTDFPEYASMSDPHSSKNIVKADWVIASVARGKQATPRQYSADPKLFFSGLVFSCVDLPPGDRDAIHGYILAVGGMYSSAITKQVTHIIALTMDSDKCEVAVRKGLQCKIVLPHWIDDCLKLRARIDEKPYRLPDPEILTKGPKDKVPDADRADLKGASSPRPDSYPTPAASPSLHRTPLTVFQRKTVLLHADLQIGSRLRGILEDLITNGGGQVTGSVHRADFLVCQYRKSSDYRTASRNAKDVGNLSWLYYLITHNKWTSPTRRLLHYPLPKGGVPGFDRFRISVSNYNGEARIYLENLAIAAGAVFTKTMKDDNTHLITAHANSEKCTAAKEWNIHIVNHLWLEETYARHQVQSLANPRYTQFPPRTNLGEVVGQTEIDTKAMETHFYNLGSDEDDHDDTAITAQPMGESTALPSKSGNHPRAQSEATAKDVALRSLPSNGTTPRGSKANRRHADHERLQTPAMARSFLSGKENETPSTGSRSAKAKAAARLHELAPDIALYEKETKRVGGVTHGGRKSQEELVGNGNRKRSKSSEDDAEEASVEDLKPLKKAKNSEASNMRLLLSGYKKWIGQPPKCESDDRMRLNKLGISVVQDPSICTHLAAPKVIRTQKFVCALAHAPVVISTRYVDDCLAENCQLDASSYLLSDPEFEKDCGYKIADSLARAQVNEGRLLNGVVVYCTDDIHGGYDTYKAITEVNGGLSVLYKARAGADAALRETAGRNGSEPDSKPAEVFLLSGTTSNEAKLWPKFRQMVEKHGKIPRVVRHDWLLHTAMSQQQLASETYELTDDDVDD